VAVSKLKLDADKFDACQMEMAQAIIATIIGGAAQGEPAG
jgi:hypothetical protein